ncbi:quinoprotein (ISS) [Halorhabdus utahensis DSM 12940]|uniref:Quinoprotein (ISS) n=1 Tax=Halorhabdus utahensis (strain DSM 12940 / JCM 11049 / AX-2) TaxID=519442 RepID=C7NR71_HALUD|nr:FG-GAP repeat protein [Halorhabdus utahensis]ACV12984.1 quinoprotein (ISS) [Halorhabdus utahensis DSM 12940]
MDLHRRDALRLVGAAGVTGLAGCGSIAAPGGGKSWSQRATLTAEDGTSGDQFGDSIAVSNDGSTIIVGAPAATAAGVESGVVSVFERAGDSWSRTATLTPTDTAEFSGFGTSVALSGDGKTAVIGCTGDERTDGLVSGAAYVFERSDDGWTQDARLSVDTAFTPAQGQYFDAFGAAVAIADDGKTALVGAPQYVDGSDDTAGTASLPGGSTTADVVAAPRSTLARVPGAAFAFERSDGEWSREATVRPEDPDGRVGLGSSVALADRGSTAVICANGRNTVSVFTRAGGSWTETTTLPLADGVAVPLDEAIGVSNDGSRVIVGNSPGDDTGGSAIVFDRADGSWSRSELSLDHTQKFGPSVAMAGDGETAIIPGLTDSDSNAVGVHVFTHAVGSWTAKTALTAESSRRGSRYGDALALSGDGTTAVVGAPGGDTTAGSGTVYVFD